MGSLELLMKINENVAALFGRLRKKYGPIFRLRVPFYTDAVFLVGGDMSKLYHVLKDDEANLNYGYQVRRAKPDEKNWTGIGSRRWISSKNSSNPV
jgi:hypothetical protein